MAPPINTSKNISETVSKVFIVKYEHCFGDDIFVLKTKTDALKTVAALMVENIPEIGILCQKLRLLELLENQKYYEAMDLWIDASCEQEFFSIEDLSVIENVPDPDFSKTKEFITIANNDEI